MSCQVAMPSSENAAFSGDKRNAEKPASDISGFDSAEAPVNFSKVALISESLSLDYVDNQ